MAYPWLGVPSTTILITLFALIEAARRYRLFVRCGAEEHVIGVTFDRGVREVGRLVMNGVVLAAIVAWALEGKRVSPAPLTVFRNDCLDAISLLLLALTIYDWYRGARLTRALADEYHAKHGGPPLTHFPERRRRAGMLPLLIVGGLCLFGLSGVSLLMANTFDALIVIQGMERQLLGQQGRAVEMLQSATTQRAQAIIDRKAMLADDHRMDGKLDTIVTVLQAQINHKTADRYTGHDADTDWSAVHQINPLLPFRRPSAATLP